MTSLSCPSLTVRQPSSNLQRLEHHFYPPSMPASNLAGDTYGDRYESTKAPTLSGGLVPVDMVTRTMGIVDMGTPSDKDVPRPSMDTSLFRHCADDEKVVLGYLFLHVDNVICRLVCARARRYRRLGSKKVEQDWADLGHELSSLVEM
jgi:hypothetical protein